MYFSAASLGYLNADRRVPCDQIRNLHCAGNLLAGSNYFLNKPDFVRSGRIELVAQKQ
jgi:hypothetical protein